MGDEMQSRLQAYCESAFPARPGVQVSGLVSISAGWENDVYAFVVEHGSDGELRREELILRIYPGDDAHDKSAHEFYGMSQLRKAGYPVPQVLLLERESSPFGKPFVIMEKIAGQDMWPLLFDSPLEKQQELLTQFCKLFVQLHTLEWRPFVRDVALYDPGNPYTFVDRQLEFLRSILTSFPCPGFLPVIEWLEARRDQVPCLQPSPIHWDFHPRNLLLRDDGSAVVIDWTQVEVSDSRFDLAWTLLLMSTHGTADMRGLILQEYERLAGAEIQHISFFDVFACLKRLGSVFISLTYGPEVLGMRPEAVDMMKEQMGAIRRVYDLLLERTGIEVPEIEELLASHC